MRPRVSATVVALGVALAGAIGCGGEERVDPGHDPADVYGRVAPDFQLNYVDLAAAREALELEEDADPTDSPSASPEESQFVRLAGSAGQFLLHPEPTLAAEVIDFGEVTEAAGNMVFGGPGMTVMRTSQDFDEIAADLEERGFERDGDVLELERPTTGTDHAIFAIGDDGLLVIGWTRELVDRAVSDTPQADPRQLELLGRVGGLARTAVTAGLPQCVTVAGGGLSLDPERVEFRVETKGPPEEARLRIEPSVTGLFEAGRMQVDPAGISVEIRPGDPGSTPLAADHLLSPVAPLEVARPVDDPVVPIYECR